MCEDESQARQQLGCDIAEALKHRLADLRAAASINDLVLGNPRIVTIACVEQIEVTLLNDVCFTFGSNHPDPPITKEGAIDWEKVTRVQIVHIGENR